MKQFNVKKYLENPNRKVVTRNGKNVRIICTNRICEYPVVALVSDEDSEVLLSYTKAGELYENQDDGRDLFFVPEKKEGWINLYNSYGEEIVGRRVYESEKAARAGIDQTKLYITTIKIEWEE